MADQLRLRITLDGQPIALDELDGWNLLLGGDVDVWPRETALELFIPLERDRDHFEEVVNQQGWNDGVQMTPTIDNNDFVFRTTPGTWLPAGGYHVRLTIVGLAGHADATVDVVDDKPGEIALPMNFVSDPRRVRLTAAISAWDPAVQGLVRRPGSTIDGRPAADWIADDSVPAQRRACVLNLLAKLRTIPSVNDPIINGVDAILCVQLERMYIRVAADLAQLPALSDDNQFKDEGTPVDDMHARLISWVKTRLRPPERSATVFSLTSYRQAVTFNSMQMVFAVGGPGGVGVAPNVPPGCYVDVDIDLGGSLTDLVGFFVHMHELTEDAITDHIDLHAGLSKEPFTQNYLYYDVV